MRCDSGLGSVHQFHLKKWHQTQPPPLRTSTVVLRLWDTVHWMRSTRARDATDSYSPVHVFFMQNADSMNKRSVLQPAASWAVDSFNNGDNEEWDTRQSVLGKTPFWEMKCWPHAELQRFIVSYTDYDRQDTIWTIFPAHMLVWTITIIPKHNLKVIRSMCAINATKVWKAAMDCSILHFIFMTVYISKLKMIFKKCVSVCVLQACNTQKHLKI